MEWLIQVFIIIAGNDVLSEAQFVHRRRGASHFDRESNMSRLGAVRNFGRLTSWATPAFQWLRSRDPYRCGSKDEVQLSFVLEIYTELYGSPPVTTWRSNFLFLCRNWWELSNYDGYCCLTPVSNLIVLHWCILTAGNYKQIIIVRR